MTQGQPIVKRRMRAPERRAQLLSVARKMFGRHGYHSVTMDSVAREAGVTKPILYDHFPSKRDLYLGLVTSDLEALKDRLHTALQASRGNRERIRKSFQAYFDFVDEHAEGFRLLMQEAIGSERELRERIRAVQDQIQAEVAELIVRESRGRVNKDEARVVSLGLIGMVESVAQEDPGAPRADRERDVDTLVRLAWRGITGLA